jgi:hypothetical protein
MCYRFKTITDERLGLGEMECQMSANAQGEAHSIRAQQIETERSLRD